MPSAKRIALELQNKDYLVGKALRWERFHPSSRDHVLCVFCWEPICSSDPSRNEGFVEPESANWICFPCLEAFLDAFKWKIEWPDEPLTLDASGDPIF